MFHTHHIAMAQLRTLQAARLRDELETLLLELDALDNLLSH